MKKTTLSILSTCFFLLGLGQAQARGKPGGDGIDPQVFAATVTGPLNSLELYGGSGNPQDYLGRLYTQPAQNGADPKNVNFVGNGGNQVKVLLDRSFLLDSEGGPFTAAEVAKCFPDEVYNVSLHLNNYKGKDAKSVAMFWLWGKSLSGGGVQYVLSFETSTGEPWEGDFPPALYGTSYRSADIWTISAPNSVTDGCVSAGNVLEGDYVFEALLQQVEVCEYPYADPACS